MAGTDARCVFVLTDILEYVFITYGGELSMMCVGEEGIRRESDELLSDRTLDAGIRLEYREILLTITDPLSCM